MAAVENLYSEMAALLTRYHEQKSQARNAIRDIECLLAEKMKENELDLKTFISFNSC